jgi:hypothetical protein
MAATTSTSFIERVKDLDYREMLATVKAETSTVDSETHGGKPGVPAERAAGGLEYLNLLQGLDWLLYTGANRSPSKSGTSSASVLLSKALYVAAN